MKRLLCVLLILCMLVPLFAGCSMNDSYTLMIYMVGSDLEPGYMSASNDIVEMLDSSLDLNRVNVLIYTGGSKMWFTEIPSDSNCVLRLAEEEGERKLLLLEQSDGLKNMGDPATLSYFLNYSYENFPASHYGLICWDHGSGPLIGFGKDMNFDGDSLDLSEMEEALESTPFGEDNKLDLVGFDACLMSSAEMACMLSRYADYMIASQETEPGEGWNYSFLDVMNKSFEPTEIAEGVISSYHEYYEAKRSATSNPELTLSCMDLSKTGKLTEAMDRLFGEMESSLNGGSYQRLAKQRADARAFGASSSSSRGWSLDMVDMLSLAKLCGEDYSEQSRELEEALGELVVLNKANTPDACGVSIYYPCEGANIYAKLGAEKYKTFGGSEKYKSYMNAYTRAGSRDWLKADNTVERHDRRVDDSSADIEGDKLTLKLDEEQKKNFSKAYLNIYEATNYPDDDEERTYCPVLYMSEVTPDGDGNISISADERVPVINGNKTISMRQVSRDNGRSVYRTIFTDVNCNDGNKLGAIGKTHRVSIYCSLDDGSDDLVINSVEFEDDGDSASQPTRSGKTTIDVNRWEYLRSTLFQGAVRRDENGAVLPFDEWSLYGGMFRQTAINSMLRLQMLPLSSLGKGADGYYYQLVILDTYGNYSLTELKSFDRKEETRELEEKTEKGKLVYEVRNGRATLKKYEGSDSKLVIPGKIAGYPVASISGKAFAQLIDNDLVADEIRIENPDIDLSGIRLGCFKRVVLPEGLKEIPDGAFSSCGETEEIVIPDSVERLGSKLFGGIYLKDSVKLKKLSLPEKLSFIGNGAFLNGDFKGKLSFRGKSENEYFKIENDLLLSRDGKKLYACLDRTAEQLKLPEGLEEIMPYVHEGEDDECIKRIEFPSTLKKIGYAAFYNEMLEELSFPDGLEEIGNYAFFGDGSHKIENKSGDGKKEDGKSYFISSDYKFDAHTIGKISFGRKLRWLGETIIGKELYGELTVSENNRFFSVKDNRLTNKYGDADLSEIALSAADNLSQNREEYRLYSHIAGSLKLDRYDKAKESKYNKTYNGKAYCMNLTLKEEEQKKDDFKPYPQITLMGKKLSFPFKYSELSSLGVEVGSNDDGEKLPDTVAAGDGLPLTLTDSDKNRAYIHAENLSMREKSTADCDVTYISISQTNLSSNGKKPEYFDFEYAGLTVGSQVGDAVSALGSPTELEITDFGTAYLYYRVFGDDSILPKGVELYFGYDAEKDRSYLEEITVDYEGDRDIKRAASSFYSSLSDSLDLGKYEKTEKESYGGKTFFKNIELKSGEKARTKLKSVIKINGESLELPFRLSKLTKLGFKQDETVFDAVGSVEAGGSAFVHLSDGKGGELSASIYNSGESEKKSDECEVMSLDVSRVSDSGRIADFEYCGLDEACSIKDAVKALGQPQSVLISDSYSATAELCFRADDCEVRLVFDYDFDDDREILSKLELEKYRETVLEAETLPEYSFEVKNTI